MRTKKRKHRVVAGESVAVWTIQDFPVKLRHQISFRARMRNLKMGALVSYIIEQWLKQKTQQDECPWPSRVQGGESES